MTEFRTMTVRDLRHMLDGMDDSDLVIFSSDYGDRHHTKQALPLTGEVDEVFITKSAYSNSGFAVVDDSVSEEDAYENGDQKYWVIS